MNTINDMESAVVAFVASLSQGKSSAQKSQQCWCNLCKADVTALAMTLLPPRYSTVHTYDNYGKLMERNYPSLVSTAVLEAMKQVAIHPKHHGSASKGAASSVKIRNFLVEKIADLIEPVIQSLEMPCSCNECLSDILALALNRSTPAYGVEHTGRVNIPSNKLKAIHQDLQLQLSSAAKIVADRPHHRRALAN